MANRVLEQVQGAGARVGVLTNHVHLLCTPMVNDATSKMMQSVGRMYVRYFNKKYGRSGTLWEGRFKSCLILSDRYLLACLRYIELNPVRAKMVSDPSEYHWSSYAANAFGKFSKLHTPHPAYLGLGSSNGARQLAYRTLFESELEKEVVEELRVSTNKNLSLGDERYKEEVERLTGKRITALKPGRRW